MPPYKKLYLHLFNAITDALQALDSLECDLAKDELKAAQQWCEEAYIESEISKDT